MIFLNFIKMDKMEMADVEFRKCRNEIPPPLYGAGKAEVEGK
jgi:hypothetical protein